MTTYKTAELEGPLLDAALSKAGQISVAEGGASDWSVCGPIIERERINIIDRAAYIQANAWRKLETGTGQFAAYLGNPEDIVDSGYCGYEGLEFDRPGVQIAPTPLIAAMRAYVASRFGETVELP